MKQITEELLGLGNEGFREFLSGLCQEKTNRSRLKIMMQRAENEQVARVRSAGLRASLPSIYSKYYDDIITTSRATYEQKIEALNNLFGVTT